MNSFCKRGLPAIAVLLSWLLAPGAGGTMRHGLARVDLVRAALQPVVTSGLADPVFVTNAHDGSRRLFIVEQAGRISVLRPGNSASTTFLDISAPVLSGGERGLLGLAFHPQYAANRRFFVNYTRKPDGATVIAEYRSAQSNPDVADPAERVLLIISQPFANHNGGMVEFGPDGYLYIGMGDGGSGNDPGNRSQNPQEYLGKILRIDVDAAEPGKPYGIPATNPFAPSGAGLGEIYALGFRNPWRFSFDRATGKLYVGDVGQDRIEEIDVVAAGGNYGWRVFEGSRCTGLGPAPCETPGFVPPVAEYAHASGRCSITGGYVYRGTRGSLPLGAYVYGDYCTGEIFMLNASTQTVLTRASISISSFGEDEDGELYVAATRGTVYRIVNPDAPGQPEIYFPRLVTAAGTGGSRDEYTGIAVTNLDANPATLTFRAHDPSGAVIRGAGIVNPRTIVLGSGAQLALVDVQIFGDGWRGADRSGWVRLESSTGRLAAFFLAFDAGLSMLDGTDAGPVTLTNFLFPDIEPSGFNRISVANPNSDSATVSLELYSGESSSRGKATRTIPGSGVLAEDLSSLFPGAPVSASDYVRGSGNQGVVAFELLGREGQFTRGLNARDASAGARVLYSPQYAVGGAYRTVLSVVNLEGDPGTVTFRLRRDDGGIAGEVRDMPIAGKAKLLVASPAFFGDFGAALVQGFVEVRSSGPLLEGSVAYGDAKGQTFSAALPLVSALQTRLVFSQAASDATYYTGVSVVNPGLLPAAALLEVFNGSGEAIASGNWPVPAGGRLSGLLTEYFPLLTGRSIGGGYIRITADRGVAAFAVFGTNKLDTLAAIPAQRSPD